MITHPLHQGAVDLHTVTSVVGVRIQRYRVSYTVGSKD